MPPRQNPQRGGVVFNPRLHEPGAHRVIGRDRATARSGQWVTNEHDRTACLGGSSINDDFNRMWQGVTAAELPGEALITSQADPTRGRKDFHRAGAPSLCRIKWLSWGDLEAAKYNPLASCDEYMPIVTSLEQPE
jgi:hypothetical protein